MYLNYIPVKSLLHDLCEPPVLAFLDWDAAIDGSRPFRLYCITYRDGFGVTLKQQQNDGSVRPITFLNRVKLQNERNWTVLELEAGGIGCDQNALGLTSFLYHLLSIRIKLLRVLVCQGR